MTKKNDTTPHQVLIREYRNSGELCGYDECGHGVRHEITWKHLHRGVIKTARRTRCTGHTGYFARKHGIPFDKSAA